mgnify:CR=1 FL=1
MKTKLFLFIILFFLFNLFFAISLTHAAQEVDYKALVKTQLDATAGETGAQFGEAQDPRMIVANLIVVMLSSLGVLFVIMVVYAGYLWLTSGGNEEKTSKAKKILFYSVLGMVVTMSSLGITLTISRYLFKTTVDGEYKETKGWGWSVEGDTGDYYSDDPLDQSVYVPSF